MKISSTQIITVLVAFLVGVAITTLVIDKNKSQPAVPQNASQTIDLNTGN